MLPLTFSFCRSGKLSIIEEEEEGRGGPGCCEERGEREETEQRKERDTRKEGGHRGDRQQKCKGAGILKGEVKAQEEEVVDGVEEEKVKEGVKGVDIVRGKESEIKSEQRAEGLKRGEEEKIIHPMGKPGKYSKKWFYQEIPCDRKRRKVHPQIQPSW